MANDEIIRMAREAGIGGISERYGFVPFSTFGTKELERFAALVAAHWQKIHEQEMSMMSELCADRILEEREACARVCEEVGQDKNYHGIAAAIRGRSHACS